MKRLLRWAFRGFVALAILLVAGILLLDVIARELLVRRIKNQTGLAAKIGRVHIGLVHPEFTIENLVLYNTAEFGGSPFIDLPELHVEYDRDALFSHRVHCPLIRLNLARVNIVEDARGRRNCDLLHPKTRSSFGAGNAPRPGSRPEKNSGGLEFAGIDKLTLTLGKATYTRLNQPGQVDELNLNMNHLTFPHIKSQDDLEGLLLIVYLKSSATVTPGGDPQIWRELLSPPGK